MIKKMFGYNCTHFRRGRRKKYFRRRRVNELEKRLENMESRRMERTEEMHAEVVGLLTREVTAFERDVDFVTNRRT